MGERERKGVMQRDNQWAEMTLRGYVAATRWDADDNVVAIEILTDEEDYEVELNKVGVELFDFLNEDVEATGFVKKGRNGAKRLQVTSYEPLPDEYLDNDELNYGYDGERELDS